MSDLLVEKSRRMEEIFGGKSGVMATRVEYTMLGAMLVVKKE